MMIDLNEDQIGLLFPAYLTLDRSGTISAIGPSMRRLVPAIKLGDSFFASFSMVNATDSRDLARICSNKEVIQARARATALLFNGTIIEIRDGYLLAISHMPQDISSAETINLQISDFGPSDPIVPSLFLIGIQKALLEESRSVSIELDQARRRSVEITARISRMSGYIAHDFNNFLSIIALNCRRLANVSNLTAQQQRLVEIIQTTAERGGDLTQALMTLSNQKHDSQLPLSVDKLVDENRALISSIAGSLASVEITLGAGSAMIQADRIGLLNCIVNLLINARDAMPDGGTIRIISSVEQLQTGKDGGEAPYIVVKFQDSGKGMSETVLSRAFEPFFSTKASGGGIGLASVREYCVEMGGHISIASTPGAGTSVRLAFPIHHMNHGDPAIQIQKTNTENKRSRIIVVEDEPYALEALKELLEEQDHDVIAFQSAVEAISFLEHETPALLLTDVIMPGMTGLELAEWASDRHPSMPIILMSGYVPDNNEFKPEWRFLRKPLAPDSIRQMVQFSLR